MSKVYESFIGVVQDKLHRGNNSTSVAQVKNVQPSGLDEEIDELENMLVQKLTVLKTAVNQGEQTVLRETRDAEEVIQTLKERVTTLSNKLKETEHLALNKESESQSMKSNLTDTAHRLQDELKQKEEALESRVKEVNDLKSERESQRKQVTELESAIEQEKTQASKELERTQQVAESTTAEIAELENLLARTEKIAQEKDSMVKTMQRELALKIETFENQIKERDKLLAARDAELEDLKTQLQVLTRGVKDMSSFFSQAETLAAVGLQENNNHHADPETGDETKFASIGEPQPVPPLDSSEETVTFEIFNRMTDRLTLIIGPLAPMIIRDHVTALGETKETFPKRRVPELLELLSKEIANEKMKIAFCEPFKRL